MMIYGISLLEAYEIESQIAIYPRIAFSNEMKSIIHSHMKFYAEDYESPQEMHVLKDENDVYFINYLAISLLDGYINYDVISKHKEIILQQLSLHKDDSYREKYDWLAFYHNYFCDNLHLSEEDSYIDLSDYKIFSFINNDKWKIDFIR